MPESGSGPILETPRLVLRRWRAEDLDPLAELNADSEVMEHFPATLSRTEAALLLARLEAGFERDGYGFWAVEVRDECPLAGFVGLAPVPADIPLAPAVEIGWRLDRGHWGRGIACEAAEAALAYGFGTLDLEEIVAYAATGNERSRRLMERLGMDYDAEGDFDHPRLPPGSRLARHVTYRVKGPRTT